MADIELVIKLSKDLYEDIKVNGLCGYSSDREAVSKAIVNGIPLPKGHGDLIDRKDLIENGINKGFCDWYDEIKMADAIIEADNVESEVQE